MHALVIDDYCSADKMHLSELEIPEPGPYELVVQTKYASLNPVDWKMRRGDLKLLLPKKFPRVLGSDFAGIVHAVGKSIKDFAVGDEVFGMANHMRTNRGAYAEYTIADKDQLAKKPAALSFEDAASIPVAGLTAFQALYDLIQLNGDQKILINGASGGVGSFAVQIAKNIGAKVYATCSAEKFELVRQLGADEIIDYNATDIYNLAEKFGGIFDASAKLNFGAAKKIMATGAIYVTTVPNKNDMIGMALNGFSDKKVKLVLAGGNNANAKLKSLADAIVEGKIRPLITETIGLSEVPQAHAQAEGGRTNGGKTVVRI